MASGIQAESLSERINTIESTYEFMLAYAAQGRHEEGDPATSEVRAYLERVIAAVDGIAGAAMQAVEGRHNALACHEFITTLADDAGKTLAIMRLILSAKSISSQLIDNLNGSIHVRALLTDLFVLDETLKSG